MEVFVKKFRDRIEELRSDKTQRAFAKEIGVPLNTLSAFACLMRS